MLHQIIMRNFLCLCLILILRRIRSLFVNMNFYDESIGKYEDSNDRAKEEYRLVLGQFMMRNAPRVITSLEASKTLEAPI